uniref:Bm4743 n=1 Tax=Brugia malayi TaxID=6279 RepID=A0A0H5RZX0_BRUMA|nr:Bm4743 [Brugia malayi]
MLIIDTTISLDLELGSLVLDSEIASMVNKFREQDVNKIDNGKVILDYQGHTVTHDPTDNALRRLFKWIDPVSLKKDTYRKWIALSNEYHSEIGVKENSLTKNRAIDDFLDTVFNTTVWESLYQFLHRKGHPYSKNLLTFRTKIKQLWFTEYSRSEGYSSSGFKHVFMGEHRDGEVSGMHSWLRFYLLERNASEEFDYCGYVIKRFNIMAAVKFTWHNHLKRIGSFFIGTSPEFDLALYTLCFLTRQSRNTCKFQLDECPFIVTSYNFMQQGKNFVGTIYPVSGPLTDKCRRYNSQ